MSYKFCIQLYSFARTKKVLRNIDFSTFLRTPIIEATRFELAASASRTRRSTKLSHTPINHKKYYTIKGYGLSRIIL